MSERAELLAVARRVVWFKPPAETLRDRAFFLAHVMTYGTLEDIAIVRRYYDDAAFQTALEQAPAGVFDARSWAYWHAVLGRLPVPPRPRRTLAVLDAE